MQTSVSIGLPLLISLLTSCGPTKLTQQGAAIQLMETKGTCKPLGVVTGSNSWARNPEVGAEGLMNIVRNKAADLGGNSLKILSTTGGAVIAEVLKCEES